MLKSIHIRIAVAIILLILISIIDFQVVYEINLAIFYLIPIVLFSYQKKLPFFYSLLFAGIASIAWSVIDYLTHQYTEDTYRLINHITRLIISIIAAIAVHQYFVEKELRTIITNQKDELTDTNQELNKLIGMAAHDIRNPVGSIKMVADMYLEKEGIPEADREWIKMIQTAANNSLQILNDTLNISKIQSGTIALNSTKSDYIQFVKDCITANHYLAINKNQTILFEISIDKIEIDFDHTRMSQVVNNLLTNAIKYSNADTSIIIKVSYDPQNPNLIVTNIIDQGLGIDEKYHASLFNPFTTTENQPTQNESSTGLGLAIVKKIVELHKGSIGFTSEKGKGSNFFFTIPINKF
jgi:signal transduction histidine kinase